MLAAKPALHLDASSTLFKSARAFETWLKKHHATSDGFWLKIAKRDAGEPSVTYPEAVEIALCWSWIGGHKKPWTTSTSSSASRRGARAASATGFSVHRRLSTVLETKPLETPVEAAQ